MSRYPTNQDRVHRLSIHEQAIRKLLPDELLIKDIGELLTESEHDRIDFYINITKACHEKLVKFTCDAINNDWSVKPELLTYFGNDNEYLDFKERARREQKKIDDSLELLHKDRYAAFNPPRCKIHRDEIKAYFQSINFWPEKGSLLLNWWPESEPKAEAVGNNDISNAPKPITPLAGSGYVQKSPTIPGANYETWCKADLWTIERAILLLLNAENLPNNNYYTSGRCDTLNEQALHNRFMEIWQVTESSLKTGLLKKTDKSYPSLISEVLPIDFINWATAKGYPIPDELQQIAEYENNFKEWRELDKPLDEAMSRMHEHNDEYKKAFDYGRTTVQLLSHAGAGARAIDKDHLQKYLKEWFEWTPEQAVCLLYGINPEEYTKIADSLDISTFINVAPKEKMTPYQWKQFGIERKIPIPQQLMDIEAPLSEPKTQIMKDAGAPKEPINHHRVNDYKQELTNGEGLPWQLAKRLCELNGWPLDSGNFFIAEREFRETIERAWRAGEIQSRSTLTGTSKPCAGIFEDTYFMLGELEELLSNKLGYPVPLRFLSGCVPAKIYGDGFSAEEQKITTLTAFLELETWTPTQAALLVCGVQPPTNCTIPCNAFGLNGAAVMANCDAMHKAKRILELWNARENSPAKVRPIDFVAWCKAKRINTGWITNADEWPDYELRQAEPLGNSGAGSQTDIVPVSQNEELTPELDVNLIREHYKANAHLMSESEKKGFLLNCKKNGVRLDLVDNERICGGAVLNTSTLNTFSLNSLQSFNPRDQQINLSDEIRDIKEQRKAINTHIDELEESKNNANKTAPEITFRYNMIRELGEQNFKLFCSEAKLSRNLRSLPDGFNRYLYDDSHSVGSQSNTDSKTEPLADAGAGNHAITEPKKPELSKLEKQKEAILNVIKAKKFKPMEIPDNEKGTIKLICQSDYSKLFEAETAFDRAWKEGINKLWRMEHHESYAKRGNN